MSAFLTAKNVRGFTIVELLVVIVVFGILLTAGTIGWGTFIVSSQNQARETELKQWAKTF